MLKPLIVIAALAVAAPSLALAQGNSNNTPASQNANGVPFTGNDPPANTFNGPPTLPVVLGPGSGLGCYVLSLDKDDSNGQNGDDKKPPTMSPNPNCQQPASP
ncbi:MAG: hypothetical protein WAK67_11580 [Xanthobacteraceae bacterium]|jgi:hypothetical protein